MERACKVCGYPASVTLRDDPAIALCGDHYTAGSPVVEIEPETGSDSGERVRVARWRRAPNGRLVARTARNDLLLVTRVPNGGYRSSIRFWNPETRSCPFNNDIGDNPMHATEEDARAWCERQVQACRAVLP